MRSQILGVLGLSALICLLPKQGTAQEVTAGVYGIVQDQSGAVIPGATVKLRNTATGRMQHTTADESGNFTVPFLPIGVYEVSAEAPGFKRVVIPDITLRVNENRRIVFTMDVGDVADSITVEAAAVAVNTASGTTSQLQDGKDMVKLPTAGRNVLPFALLMPGVVSDDPYSRTANRAMVNGIRPTHNAWLLDGGYNIDTGGNWGSPMAPNLESVAEFRAIRGNYSAEFGTGGGSQFNVITKSGTNDLHGTLYYWLRNDKLNARNYFSPRREPFKGNDFGFSVGGPVYIPKVYDGRNKTFFFVLLGWVRERQEQQFSAILPTPAQRSGDFSALGKTIVDPDTKMPFPNNVIPSSMLDPNALAYSRMYPELNFADSAGRNWTALQGRLADRTERNFRVDHHFSETHRVMYRYTPEYRLSRYKVSPGFDFLQREDRVPARNMTANYNAVLRPNLINDFNWTRSHNRIMYFPPEFGSQAWGINIPQIFEDTPETYPLDSLNLKAVPDRVPGFSITGYAGVNPDAPWSNYQTIYELKDNLTWIKGKHTLKTGFYYSYEIKFEPTNTNVFGTFNFDGRYTNDGYADFLLGRAASYQETNTVAFNDNRRNSFEAYVDDSWKVSRKLTLNLGLRASFFRPAYEPDDRYRIFVPEAYDTSKAVAVDPTTGRIPRGVGDRFNGLVNPKSYWRTSNKNFAPRFSFAYDLFGNGKTALRGGYGLFYSREILGAFILMSGNPPFSELLTIENTRLSNPFGGSQRNFDLPITLGNIDPNQLTPYSQQWNFNIQHGLSGNTVLEIGYSGSRTIHMMRSRDLNQPLPDARIAQGLLSADSQRPYKGWSTINHREQSYNANYHGLQLGLNRNFSNGLMFQVAYTFSKTIDNADFSGGIYGIYPNTRNARTERGRASLDVTHNFVASYLYELPFLKNRNDLIGKVFGGWQISGVTSIRTGMPIGLTIGRDYAGVGYATGQRPVALANPALPKGERTIDRWFDTSVLTLPAFGTFSPLSRNILTGPGWNNFDMSFTKFFRLGESRRLELRADGFNVFNHTQFNGVGTSYLTPQTFGKITSVRNPRSFMIGSRLEF